MRNYFCKHLEACAGKSDPLLAMAKALALAKVALKMDSEAHKLAAARHDTNAEHFLELYSAEAVCSLPIIGLPCMHGVVHSGALCDSGKRTAVLGTGPSTHARVAGWAGPVLAEHATWTCLQ